MPLVTLCNLTVRTLCWRDHTCHITCSRTSGIPLEADTQPDVRPSWFMSTVMEDTTDTTGKAIFSLIQLQTLWHTIMTCLQDMLIGATVSQVFWECNPHLTLLMRPSLLTYEATQVMDFMVYLLDNRADPMLRSSWPTQIRLHTFLVLVFWLMGEKEHDIW